MNFEKSLTLRGTYHFWALSDGGAYPKISETATSGSLTIKALLIASSILIGWCGQSISRGLAEIAERLAY